MARPHSTMFPVMTLVKTPPSRVKAVTSAAPEAKVSAIAITVSARSRSGLLVTPRTIRSVQLDPNGPGPFRPVRRVGPEQAHHHPDALGCPFRPRGVPVGQDHG